MRPCASGVGFQHGEVRPAQNDAQAKPMAFGLVAQSIPFIVLIRLFMLTYLNPV